MLLLIRYFRCLRIRFYFRSRLSIYNSFCFYLAAHLRCVYHGNTHTRARARRRLIIECWVLQYKKPNVYTAIKQILVEFVSTLRIFNSSSFDFQVISWIREILLLLAVYYARSPVLFIIIIYVLLFRALTLHQTQFIRANISSST